MDTNIQRPFAYLHKGRKKKLVTPLNYKWELLPRNYAGICVYCFKPTQKVPKVEEGKIPITGTCKKCGAYVVAFPKELLPWRLLPSTLPGAENLLSKDYRFGCSMCGITFRSVSIFGAMCLHKTHSIYTPGHGIACRFCCRTISKKILSAIEETKSKDFKPKKLRHNNTGLKNLMEDIENGPSTFRFEPIREFTFSNLEQVYGRAIGAEPSAVVHSRTTELEDAPPMSYLYADDYDVGDDDDNDGDDI